MSNKMININISDPNGNYIIKIHNYMM